MWWNYKIHALFSEAPAEDDKAAVLDYKWLLGYCIEVYDKYGILYDYFH